MKRLPLKHLPLLKKLHLLLKHPLHLLLKKHLLLPNKLQTRIW